jgi:UrcA family protein
MSNAHEHEKSVSGVRKPRRRDRRLPTGLEATEIRVRYKYRDLTSPTAARSLLRRIGDAALESCGASSFSLAEFKTATELSQCWRDAVDDAVRRIGSPALSAVASEGRP